MVYRFIKSDEDKYLIFPFWLKDNYCEVSCYVIKVFENIVVYRSFFFIQGMDAEEVKKHPDIWRWHYKIERTEDNEFSSYREYSYPLRLTIFGCPYPKKDLTEEEQQKIVEFEQGKDITEWLQMYNFGRPKWIAPSVGGHFND